MIGNQKIGIAFSGGGGRGFFHIGVMKALEELAIKVDVVSGTSAGSVAGLCLAAGLRVDDFHGSLPTNPVYNFKNLSPGIIGLTKLKTLEDFINKFIPYKRISELPVKFKAVCTDLDSSLPYAPEDGDIIQWVSASCAVPIVVKPVEMDDKHFADGGLSCNLPARFIRDDCDLLIGVNLFPPTSWDSKSKASWRTIANRTVELNLQHNATFDIQHCDLVISELALGNFKPYKYHRKDELINLGYQAGLKELTILIKRISNEEIIPKKG